MEYPPIYIYAFSTPDYEPFNTIFSSTLHETLKSYGGKSTVKHKIAPLETAKTDDSVEYMSEPYKAAIIEKVRFVIASLKDFLQKAESNAVFIFSDCDIQFFEKNATQWNGMISWFLTQTNQLAFMREANLELLNSGFFMIKYLYIESFIEVLKVVLNAVITHIDRKDRNITDQEVLQLMQKDMNIILIPNEFIIYGHYPNYTALLHHAAGFPTRADKIKLLELVKTVVESNGSLELVKLKDP